MLCFRSRRRFWRCARRALPEDYREGASRGALYVPKAPPKVCQEGNAFITLYHRDSLVKTSLNVYTWWHLRANFKMWPQVSATQWPQDQRSHPAMMNSGYTLTMQIQLLVWIGGSDPGQASTKNMISALPQCNTYCLYYIRITQTIDCCQRALDISKSSLVRRGPKETSMAPSIRLCFCGTTKDKYGYTVFSASLCKLIVVRWFWIQIMRVSMRKGQGKVAEENVTGLRK